ncbi:MAG: pantoate--beta-alanine ligase [Deltaproteobacteria bacterium]|nr:pantoate--beta-alanine ligase [Deltaproteobacteria bacterium]
MKVVRDIAIMQKGAEQIRREGKRIAFVPTMGYLHDGHRALLREGRKKGDLLILSIFVNPIQFGPSEDLERYPRDWDRDCAIAREEGIDLLFAPEASSMYPAHFQTTVHVEQVTQGLCGASRPGHFDGVSTVVAKLFNIVKPHVALFGEKDYQQLATLRRMVEDLNFDTEIVGVPTVRESDGLAMSSRNVYLSSDERKVATVLHRSLEEGLKQYRSGQREVPKLLHAIQKGICEEPKIQIDYLEIRDAESLEPISMIERKAVAAVAARIGKTRLIDNILIF